MGYLPARVVLDLPNWLGDFIHALPPLARVAAANAGGETWAVLPAAHIPLARLAGVRTIARPADAGFVWARRALRGRFDVALTLRHSTRAKLLIAGAGAALPLASAGRGAAALGLQTFAVMRSRHQRHDFDEALESLGLAAVDEAPFVLPLPPPLVRSGLRQRELLADHLPLVALLPGSHGLDKRYPIDRYTAVARALAEGCVASVAVVGPGEEVLASAFAATTNVRIAPTTWPLDATASLLAACDAAVGNDSGLTHVAALVGCPTLALFGPTEPWRTSPVGGARVLCAGENDAPGPIETVAPARIVGELLEMVAGAGSGAESGWSSLPEQSGAAPQSSAGFVEMR